MELGTKTATERDGTRGECGWLIGPLGMKKLALSLMGCMFYTVAITLHVFVDRIYLWALTKTTWKTR